MKQYAQQLEEIVSGQRPLLIRVPLSIHYLLHSSAKVRVIQ